MTDQQFSMSSADIRDVDVTIKKDKLVKKLQKVEGQYITAKWNFNGEIEYASGYLQNIDNSSMSLWQNRTNGKYTLENLSGFYIWDETD